MLRSPTGHMWGLLPCVSLSEEVPDEFLARCWPSARWSWIVPVQEPLSLTGHMSARTSLQFSPNYVSLTHRAAQIAPLMVSARWEGPLRGMSISLLKYDRRLCICRLLSQIVAPRCLRVDTICTLDCRFLWR